MPGPARTCAPDAGPRAGPQAGATVRLDWALLEEAAVRLDLDLGDRDQVQDLVAVAMTRLAWRDGPVEDWHAYPYGRISNGEMMRANAATTRLVRETLDDLGPKVVVGNRVSEADEVFAAVGRALADSRRRLPDGRTVAELAPDAAQLAAFERHVWMFCTRWSGVAGEYGASETMALLAVYAGRYCWRWWLAPKWPVVVDEFMRRWHNAMTNRLGDIGRRDTSGGDLGDLLLAGPDRLTASAAAHCLRLGLGCLLPQDCDLPALPRHALPPGYFRLVDHPAALTIAEVPR